MSVHSFVILAYKESPFLEECIKSLLAQSIKSDVFISTSTPSQYLNNIADKYKLPLLINKGKNGIAGDWNFAIDNCKTEYITLAHQDDIYLPQFTESLLKYIHNNSGKKILMLFTGYNELINGKVRKNSINLLLKNVLLTPFLLKNNINNKFFKKIVLSLGNPIPCPAVTFNKHNIADFKFSESLTYNLDWQAWLDLADMNGCFVRIREKLMLHRLHESSQTSVQINDNTRYLEEKLMFQKIWGKYFGNCIAWFYKSGAKSNKL